MLTSRKLERYIALEVAGSYHSEVHGSLGVRPAADWAVILAAGWAPRAPGDPARLAVDFLPLAERMVGREGLRLFSRRAFDGALASHTRSPVPC